MRNPQTLRRAAVLFYCAVIFYLSSRNDFPDIPSWYPGWLPDSHLFAHFLLYTGLGFVVWFDFSTESVERLKHFAKVATVVFCALYGLSDETHQLFVPGRRFELADLAMDTLGAAAAMTAVSVFYRYEREREAYAARSNVDNN